MNTKKHHIKISGISVEIVRKDIKNLHLGVYPPNGRVRVAAPLSVSDEAVRLAIINKLGWIRKQQRRFDEQSRQSEREYVSGESHYFFGHRYRLRVHEHEGSARIVQRGSASIYLYVRPGTSPEQRDRTFQNWYRSQLKAMIPPLMEKWQKELGVEASYWGVKKMKTKWGSCNNTALRVWFNLELAKKPLRCLEYVVVHELTHLIERKHSDRFTELMDTHLPNWRICRQELNATPLAHETWGC